MTTPSEHSDTTHAGHDFTTIVVKYVLPYNTLLAFAGGLAALAGVVSPWLLAGFALTLQVLLIVMLTLDGAFRHELVAIGRRGAQQNRRIGHFIRFLWPSDHARMYKTAPFWALAVITIGISAYAAHHWQVEIDRIATKKAELAAKWASRQAVPATEGMPVGNPALNIPGTTAFIRSGSVVRVMPYGTLRFVVADAVVKGFIVADHFVEKTAGVKSAEVTAEVDCERGNRIQELGVTTYSESNWAGQSRHIPAMELYWRDISEGQSEMVKFDRSIESIVCRYHRPGEPMDDG